MTLVLASQSASRRAMLEAAGVAFAARPANLDERAFESALPSGSPPAHAALALAEAKALAVAATEPGKLVLGSDSLVDVAGRRFDKPCDRIEAAEHLRYFSGRTMHLHSAAALVCGETVLWGTHAMAKLQVRALSEDFITSYLDQEWPAVAGCVGVFRIEAIGVQLFDAIDGDQFTVLGMPLLPVLAALRDFGELQS